MLKDTAMNKNYTYIKNSNGVIYGLDEVCPICGCYTADGDVCNVCQKGLNPFENSANFDTDSIT